MEHETSNTNELGNDANSLLHAVLLDVNERYYFKTRGQEPDVECTQRCMFRDNGICIGSAACQKCEHHFENNVDEWGCISWIKCRKINEAVSKNDSQRIEGFA